MDPSVSVDVSHDFVRKVLGILLDHGVVKSTTDQSLGRKESVLGIGDSLREFLKKGI